MLHKAVYEKRSKVLRQRLIDDDDYRHDFTRLACDGDKWTKDRQGGNGILPMRKKLSDAMNVEELTRLG